MRCDSECRLQLLWVPPRSFLLISVAALMEAFVLARCLTTVCLVALICALLSHFEQARGEPDIVATRFDTSTWVRTVDGWEPPQALRTTLRADTLPRLHPLAVAGFQISASLLALIVFPAAKSLAERRREQQSSGQLSDLRSLIFLRS